MKKYNSRAVVLRNFKYKDSDKIFTLFTKEYGKISALARGVRKISSRRSGNLDTLNLISVKIHEERSGIKNIEEVKTLESFKTIKKDLKKSLKAYYIAELVHKSTEEGEKLESIFNLLVRFLKVLEKNGYSGDLFVTYFEINLMKLLGYELTLDKCRKCGKVLDESWEKYKFNIDNGSIECEKCSRFGVGLTKECALAFKSVSEGKMSKDLHPLFKEMDKVMKIYIGRKLEDSFKSLEIDLK
jgi:DNA repair protein RecO (recombination protein O)